MEALRGLRDTKVPKLNTRVLITNLHLRRRAGASESERGAERPRLLGAGVIDRWDVVPVVSVGLSRVNASCYWATARFYSTF
ncbi:MAG: hypothetical protein GY820_01920 [Gammaproteobacteria bacterium]|nr:hypothetical protein [Gammaproteobacteria bacterium]